MEREIVIDSDLSEIIRVTLFTKEIGVSLQLSSYLNIRIGLAIEEAISCIIRNAYLTKKNGQISIRASYIHGDLTFLIADDGHSLDPEVVKEHPSIPSIKQILTEGPGFFYISRAMDEITYHTVHSQNYLMLTKRIDDTEQEEGSMHINICKIDDTLVLTIEGRLDTAQARKFESSIQPILERVKKTLIINCKELTFISSSGLRSFILLQKHITEQHKYMVLESIRPDIRKIFNMTGCTFLFNMR